MKGEEKHLYYKEGMHGIEKKVQIELICSMQMELRGREMSPWEIGS